MASGVALWPTWPLVREQIDLPIRILWVFFIVWASVILYAIYLVFKFSELEEELNVIEGKPNELVLVTGRYEAVCKQRRCNAQVGLIPTNYSRGNTFQQIPVEGHVNHALVWRLTFPDP